MNKDEINEAKDRLENETETETKTETEEILTPEMVKHTIIGDPVTVQTTVEALSERTRLFILKCLQSTRGGLTATELAKLVNKRVPTILYHLEHLKEAGLVYDESRPRIEGDRREVKHWMIVNKQVVLDISLNTLPYLHRSLDSYLISFLTYMRKTRVISQDSLAEVTTQEIVNNQRVNEEFAVTLQKYLTVEKITELLKDLLDAEFTKIIEIEKGIKKIINKNYLHEKALLLMNQELIPVFGQLYSQILDNVSRELLKRRPDTSHQIRAFIADIAAQYQLTIHLPLRLTIQEIATKYGVSLDIAVKIRNLLLSTGKYAVDRTERLFLR
ncbi:MAG: helix-turn-helix domain-containing protein [Candidatus Hodarchaeota archaeon]